MPQTDSMLACQVPPPVAAAVWSVSVDMPVMSMSPVEKFAFLHYLQSSSLQSPLLFYFSPVSSQDGFMQVLDAAVWAYALLGEVRLGVHPEVWPDLKHRLVETLQSTWPQIRVQQDVAVGEMPLHAAPVYAMCVDSAQNWGGLLSGGENEGSTRVH